MKSLTLLKPFRTPLVTLPSIGLKYFPAVDLADRSVKPVSPTWPWKGRHVRWLLRQLFASFGSAAAFQALTPRSGRKHTVKSRVSSTSFGRISGQGTRRLTRPSTPTDPSPTPRTWNCGGRTLLVSVACGFVINLWDPVITTSHHHRWAGTTRSIGNSDELSALYHALNCIFLQLCDEQLVQSPKSYQTVTTVSETVLHQVHQADEWANHSAPRPSAERSELQYLIFQRTRARPPVRRKVMNVPLR